METIQHPLVLKSVLPFLDINNDVLLQYGCSPISADALNTINLPVVYKSLYYVFALLKDNVKHGSSGIASIVSGGSVNVAQFTLTHDYTSSNYGSEAQYLTIGFF